MPSTRNRLDFEDTSGPVKVVKHLIPVEIFLAAGIVDGEGVESNRLIIRPKGAPVNAFRYMLTKNAEAGMEVPAGWVFDEIERKLSQGSEPIPESKVSVSVGSPMQKGK